MAAKCDMPARPIFGYPTYHFSFSTVAY